MRYRFGEDEVDAGRFVLLQAGSPVPIEPGGLCASAAVRDQISGRLPLEWENLGEQGLKGHVDPVRVHRLRSRDRTA